MSEGRLADLRWEVVVFGLNKNLAKLNSRSDIWSDLLQLLMPPQGFTTRSNPFDEVALDDEIRREGLIKGAHPETVRNFHAFIRNGLDTMFKAQWWTYEGLPNKKSIAIPNLVNIHRADAALYKLLRADQILELRAFELIDAEKKRLMICENPKCTKRFIATKEGRTRFHSPTCSAYVRIAKSRGKQLYDKDVPAEGIQKYLATKQ